MQQQERAYPFVVVAKLNESGTVRTVDVEVYDPEDESSMPTPIAEGSAPAYGDDGLETAVYRAFSQLQIPPNKVLPEVDDLIKQIEEDQGRDLNV